MTNTNTNMYKYKYIAVNSQSVSVENLIKEEVEEEGEEDRL